MTRMKAVPVLLATSLAVAAIGGCKEKAVASDDPPGCAKDADCKGDRVCIAGKCQPQSPAQVTQPSTAAQPGASTTAIPPAASGPPLTWSLAKATISVPPNKHGIAQRAIIKDKPGGAGTETARIESGTPVGVIKKAEGGLWVNIRWPWPDGTQEGWVHVNLLRE